MLPALRRPLVATHNDPALRDKVLPLISHKKGQVRFRAVAGYPRLTIVAQKPQ
jgi:hypothetical protein